MATVKLTYSMLYLKSTTEPTSLGVMLTQARALGFSTNGVVAATVSLHATRQRVTL